MPTPYDLNQLDSHTFEHLVNFLALKVLGNGVTGFAAGPDAGRDGYLIGKAPYPTPAEQWEGTWYIQSKFLKSGLSNRPQPWLISQVKNEIAEFQKGSRTRPDNWIIATNVEPTATGTKGSYDRIKKLVHDEFGGHVKVDIWGGKKILDYLAHNESASRYYGHFITPGHIISKLYDELTRQDQKTKNIIDHLIVNQFSELIYTKLEQAGSGSDQRPKIYELFEDLPIKNIYNEENDFIMKSLVSTSCNVQKASAWSEFGDGWKAWSRDPCRARVILLKGGPGQGKSTAGQYFTQIQRAAFILSENGPNALPAIIETAKELQQYASKSGYWPKNPRVPVFVELKDYANWYNSSNGSKSIQTYICNKIFNKTGINVSVEKFCDALANFSWFVNFDGLDEVPNDLKDAIANEIITFSNELCPMIDADVLILCTTRPQGYSGQFENLESAVVGLEPLPPEIALSCASSVVKYNRAEDEGLRSIEILKSAMKSPQVKELMTTPLQSHIMAVVVRDGGRPPERRWELFSNFYKVMKKRESLKDFLDKKISKILQENDVLLKSIHDRLGIALHAKAENSNGAEATLDKVEFRKLAEQTTEMLQDGNVAEIVNSLMEATTERLVFVNTPESSNTVRFDIRQLQEFFAAEFIYNSVASNELRERLELICSDSHWREVVHFALSALSNDTRLAELALAIDILAKTDDHIDDFKIRGYKKRLATGALAALRLLIEGVLEQDKRIRHQFSKVIQPLWGVVDYEMYSRINSIHQEQSRAWLINNMIDNLFELDYSENISSGYLLTIMLTEEHERFSSVKNKIIDSPDYYLNAIIDMSANFDMYNNTQTILQPSNWFMKELINIVLFDTTKKITILNSCMKIFKIFFTKFNTCAESEEFKATNIKFLIEIFKEERKDFKVDESERNKADSYGILQIISNTHSWVTGTQPQSFTDIEFTGDKNSILLELMKLIIIFSNKKDIGSYKEFLNLFVVADYNSDGIPTIITSLIPINFESSNIKEHILTLSDFNGDDLKNLMNKEKVKNCKISSPISMAMFNEKKYNIKEWEKLCSHFPLMALHVWGSSLNNKFHSLQKDEKVIQETIIEILLADPKVSSNYIALWGELFENHPDKESKLRKSFLENIRTDYIHSRFVSRELKAFKIDLINEIEFLIPLSHVLTSSHTLYNNNNFHSLNARRVHYTETEIEKYGLSNDILLKIARDIYEKPTIRISALSIFMGQNIPSKTEAVSYFFEAELDKLFVSLLNQGNNEGLVAGLYVLFSATTIDTLQKMSFIGEVSNSFKDNFKMRIVLQDLFSRWRERSAAPVQQSGKLKDWLEYTY
jgi:ribosomal protein S6